MNNLTQRDTVLVSIIYERLFMWHMIMMMQMKRWPLMPSNISKYPANQGEQDSRYLNQAQNNVPAIGFKDHFQKSHIQIRYIM